MTTNNNPELNSALIGTARGAASGPQGNKPAPVLTTINAVSADDRVNAKEAGAGVQVTGTSQPNGLVRVQWGGASRIVSTDADGKWSLVFKNSEVPASSSAGGSRTEISATAMGPNVDASNVAKRSVLVDLVAPTIPTIKAVSGDGKVNAAEARAGVDVTGTAEAGSAVQVRWGTVVKTVQVDNKGNWTAKFAQAEVAANASVKDVTAVAVDASGNAGAAAVQRVAVDLVAPREPVIFTVAGDDRVTAAEAAGGVKVMGAAEPMATLQVQWGKSTRSVVADAQGKWEVQFTAADVLEGSNGKVEVLAKALDAAGNVSALTRHAVVVDAVATPAPAPQGAAVLAMDEGDAAVALSALSAFSSVASDNHGARPTPPVASPITIHTVAGDDRVNAAEAAAGVQVTGTSEPLSQVKVSWGKTVKTVTAGPDGQWAVDYQRADLPPQREGGGHHTAIMAQLVEPAGTMSQAPATRIVQVDTSNPTVTLKSPIEGDNRVTRREAADGVLLEGYSEPGAKVYVLWGNVARNVEADPAGRWKARFEPHEVQTSETTDVTVRMHAMDTFGNVGAPLRQVVTVEGGTSDAITVPTVITRGTQLYTPGTGSAKAKVFAGIEFTGTAKPNALVDVWFDKAKHQAASDASGQWKLVLDSDDVPALNGVWTDVRAQLAVAEPGVSNPAGTFKMLVDNVAPQAPSIEAVAGDNLLNVNELSRGTQVWGKAEAGSVVDVTWGAVTKTVTADRQGQWKASYTPIELEVARHADVVTAMATDRAGNTSVMDIQEVKADVVAPSRPLIEPITGDARVSAVEARSPVLVTGQAEPNALVEIRWDARTLRFDRADEMGRWEAVFSPEEVQRSMGKTLDVMARVTDSAHNVGEWAHQMVMVDAKPQAGLTTTLAAADSLAALTTYADLANRHAVLS